MTSALLGNLLKLHDESTSRDKIRTDLTDWATDILMSTGLTPSAHHRYLLNKLTLVTTGDVKRLMVLMPPGSAKSTYTSVVFPIWWFMQHPRSSIIATSHTAGLVQHFSHRIHELILENRHKIGFSLRKDDHSKTHWRTDTGGEYFAVGVRGAITGRRADLVIIDDPIKSMAEVESPKRRQQIWDWYTAELTARLKPDARIVLVMTRWHEQDLGGQLVGQDAENWEVLRLPAVADDNDPIGRPKGSPLWPEWENLDALTRKQAVVGNRTWFALFQQTPRHRENQLFDTGNLQVMDQSFDSHRTIERAVRAWDLAATPASENSDPDWTAGVKLALTTSGRYVIEDVVRFRGNYHTVHKTLIAVAHSDGQNVVISLPIDPGQAGKSQVAQLSAHLAGYRLYVSRERGSKLSRAIPVAAQIDAGNVTLSRGSWNQVFLDELEAFPQGKKDDQVDALSRAFLTLCDIPGKARRLDIPFNVR